MILLKRNNKVDANFSSHSMYIDEGDIVALTEIRRFSLGVIPTVEVRVPESSIYSFLNPFVADLNCFDYVKGES